MRGSIARYITLASSIYGRRLQSNDKYFNQKCPTNAPLLSSSIVLFVLVVSIVRKEGVDEPRGEELCRVLSVSIARLPRVDLDHKQRGGVDRKVSPTLSLDQSVGSLQHNLGDR